MVEIGLPEEVGPGFEWRQWGGGAAISWRDGGALIGRQTNQTRIVSKGYQPNPRQART